jgi:ribonuclease HII
MPDLAERLRGARDSKQMTARQRARLRETIQALALGWGVGMATSTEIDTLGLVPALKLAFGRALAAAAPACQPDYLLLDFVRWPECPLPAQPIRHGDSLSLSIACASILAKTARDEWMEQIGAQHPEYGFAQHKGYGTRAHAAALRRYGVLPHVHRASFQPIRDLLKAKQEQTP